MTDSSQLTHTALLALGILSITCSIFLLQTAQLMTLSHGWFSLTAFFSVGMVFKTIEAMRKYERAGQLQPRIVTVEFDWSLHPQEVTI